MYILSQCRKEQKLHLQNVDRCEKIVLVHYSNDTIRKMKRSFYIGYQDKAPKPLTRFLRVAVLVIIVLALVIGGLISSVQNAFNDGKFELGKRTQFTGFVEQYPIPLLRVENEHNDGYKNILLIGFGKFGADSTLAEMERFHEISFEENQVTLEGTQIYLGDMRLLELTEKKFSLLNWQKGKPSSNLEKKFVGQTQLAGEVIDPKCYFGVMKPGEGKTHRSCAIRCISGGIPPMLKTTDGSSEPVYTFILGANESPQQAKWAPLAGLKNTRITGEAFDWNGWRVIVVN